MAIYHFSANIISRSGGKSSVASAAYRAGEKLTDEKQGLTFDYTRKENIEFSNVILPQNAPREYQDRETLWNEIERIEKTKDAQLAREFICAIPHELSKEQGQEMVERFAKSLAQEGMCVDYSIHDKGNNRHVHIMTTMRPLKENGEWGAKSRKVYDRDEQGEKIPIIDKKTGEQKVDKQNRKQWKSHKEDTTDWNTQDKLMLWRDRWASVCNQALEQAKSQARVTHLSHKARGIEQIPTIHEGYAAREIEKRGITSDRCELNRKINDYNILLQEVRELKLEVAAENENGQEVEDDGEERSRRLAAAIRESEERSRRLAEAVRESEERSRRLAECRRGLEKPSEESRETGNVHGKETGEPIERKSYARAGEQRPAGETGRTIEENIGRIRGLSKQLQEGIYERRSSIRGRISILLEFIARKTGNQHQPGRTESTAAVTVSEHRIIEKGSRSPVDEKKPLTPTSAHADKQSPSEAPSAVYTDAQKAPEPASSHAAIEKELAEEHTEQQRVSIRAKLEEKKAEVEQRTAIEEEEIEEEYTYRRHRGR